VSQIQRDSLSLATVLPKRMLASFMLGVCALVPYLHTLRYGFINYDDPATILNLPLIRELSLAALPRFFAPDVYAHLPEYMPLKNLSYALDYALFELHAPGYRMQQLGWFMASVLLTHAWLRRLLDYKAKLATGSLPAGKAHALAFLTCMLFAFHPVHVESVTWLSGRKDVLAGTFMAAAMYAALRYSIARSTGAHVQLRYLLACAASSALALLSKPTALTLPALLLLQEWFLVPPNARAWPQLRARLPCHVPVALLCAGFAAVYVRVTSVFAQIGNVRDDFAGPLWLRLGQQLLANLRLSFLPTEIVPIYPAYSFETQTWTAAGAQAAVTLVLCISLLLWGLWKRNLPGFALGFFCCALLPSLARPVWGQFVAGRYLFHAVLGPCLLVAWTLALLADKALAARSLGTVATFVIAVMWAALTGVYAACFRDSATLWAYSASVHPEWPVFYDLGARDALMHGDVARAGAILERCVTHNPGASICKGPLGGLTLMSDPERGERLLREALTDDDQGTAHLRLAQHLAHTGRALEGLALYEHYLTGRGTSPAQIIAITELALVAGDMSKARAYVRQIVRAAALTEPASPPPAAAVTVLVGRMQDPRLLERVHEASKRCTRSDCFAQALGL
jgi:hypothetical protein